MGAEVVVVAVLVTFAVGLVAMVARYREQRRWRRGLAERGTRPRRRHRLCRRRR